MLSYSSSPPLRKTLHLHAFGAIIGENCCAVWCESSTSNNTVANSRQTVQSASFSAFFFSAPHSFLCVCVFFRVLPNASVIIIYHILIIFHAAYGQRCGLVWARARIPMAERRSILIYLWLIYLFIDYWRFSLLLFFFLSLSMLLLLFSFLVSCFENIQINFQEKEKECNIK